MQTNFNNGWQIDIAKDLQCHWQGPNILMDFTSRMDFEVKEKPCDDKHRWKFINRQYKEYRDQGFISRSLTTDEFSSGDFRITRQILLNKELSSFHIRFSFVNMSSNSVRLLKFTLVNIESAEKIKIGDEGFKNWSLMRQGRHKNDIPSTFITGQVDSSYRDGVTGLSESGKYISGKDTDIPADIISDELTVIKGSRGKGPGSMLFGFLTGKSQLVEFKIRTNQQSDFTSLEISCLMDGITLGSGNSIDSEWLRIDAGEDVFKSIDLYSKIKGRMSDTKAKGKPPSVYCTWYYYHDSVNEQDILTNLKYMDSKTFPIDVFQIDEGWESRWGDWIPNTFFPSGMKNLAEKIVAKGYRPGIWTCPFIVEPRCKLIFYHPDWLLRKADGTLVKFNMNEMDNYVLDPTHPEVIIWLEDLYKNITFQWGYTYHKLDFTRAVAVYPNVVYHKPGVTRAQAFRMGIEAVRRGAGKDAYILICGGLFSAPAGLVDGHRTSSDVLSMWPEGDRNNKEPVAPYTIKQNVLRYWMNSLWHNDPDALMVRRQKLPFRGRDIGLGLLTDEEAKVFTLNQYIGGGLICFTEPMETIDRDRLGLLRHVIPSLGKAGIPRDMMDANRYPQVFDVEIIPKWDDSNMWHTVSIVNWQNECIYPEIRLDESLIGDYSRNSGEFTVTEFWSGMVWKQIRYGETIKVGGIQPHSAILLKVEVSYTDKPQIIYSNGHFSMGGAEVSSMIYKNNELKLDMDWKWDYPLKIILSAPNDYLWNNCKIEQGKILVEEDNLQLEFNGRCTESFTFRTSKRN